MMTGDQQPQSQPARGELRERRRTSSMDEPTSQSAASENAPSGRASRIKRRKSSNSTLDALLERASVRVAVIDVGSNSIRLVVADCSVSSEWVAARIAGNARRTERAARISALQSAKSPTATEAKTPAEDQEAQFDKLASSDVEYHVVAEEKATTRLVSGLDITGRMDQRMMEQSATAIANMVKIAEQFGVSKDRVRAVATCAVREAANRREFIGLVKQWAGVKLKVISAKREAKLAFLSARAAFDLAALGAPDSTPPSGKTSSGKAQTPASGSRTGGVAVLDIGGGSTELVLTGRKKKAGRIKRTFLLPIGAVRATERFGGPDVAAAERFAELTHHLRRLVRKRIWEVDKRPSLVIGTGGTVTSLAQMLLSAGIVTGPRTSGPPRLRVQDVRLTTSQIESALLHLRSLDSASRELVPGLASDRADIIVGGLAILLAVLARLGNPTLIVHTGGLRDGLIRRIGCQRLLAAAERRTPAEIAGPGPLSRSLSS